jgi:hypothetical protein
MNALGKLLHLGLEAVGAQGELLCALEEGLEHGEEGLGFVEGEGLVHG